MAPVEPFIDQVPELGLQPFFTFPEITNVVAVASMVMVTLSFGFKSVNPSILAAYVALSL